MAFLNFVLNIVLVSIIKNANCHPNDTTDINKANNNPIGSTHVLTTEEFKKRLHLLQSRTATPEHNWEYYFKDNETIELFCTVHFDEDWCRNTPCVQNGTWTEDPNPYVDSNRSGSVPTNIIYKITRQLQKVDHGTILRCSSSIKGVKSSYVKLLFDLTQFLDPVLISMEGKEGTYLKEKWTFVNITRTQSRDKEPFLEILFYYYEYKFYDGEDTQFCCTKYENGYFTPHDIVVQTQLDRRKTNAYETTLHSWDDNIVSLICSAQVNENMVHVVTKLVWDPTDIRNSDTIIMYGFDKDRWIFINQTEGYKTITYFFSYTFFDGEISEIVCKKISKNNAGDRIPWEIKSGTLAPVSGESEKLRGRVIWNPSYHEATLTCNYYNSFKWTRTIINTTIFWNYSHPENFKSSYVQYEGFDSNRLKTRPGFKNFAVYKFYEEEILNLTCTKAHNKSYSIPGYTKWIYDNSLTPLNVGNAKESTSIELQSKSSLNEQNLTCAYYLDDTVVDSQVVLLKKTVTHGNDKNDTNYGNQNYTTKNYDDNAHDNNEKVAVTSADDIKDKVDYMPWVYAMIVLLVAIGVIFILKRYCKLIKAHKERERNYQNIPNDTSLNQFPPTLENIYALPFGSSQPTSVKPVMPEYANANIQEIEIYSLPYVENNVDKHQLALQNPSPYTSSTQVNYASVNDKTSEPSVPLYSQVIKKSERKVEKSTYINVKDAENVEPAYSELIK